ncbi:DUF4811 domain-containing protein, partial [Enterococcus faecium]|uniref:DUF4811 domain-containing protein n=1 Tax=Enterococcus faecium TaxID=1352 RepID=UPI003CC6CACE
SNHFGMEKVTETITEKIVSSADSQGEDLLLYKALGNGKVKVYLYRTNEKQEKPKAPGTDFVTNKEEKKDGDPEKVTKTSYWE